MKKNAERSLKSLNMKWLVLLAIADMLTVLLFVVPEMLIDTTLTQVAIGRILTTTLMPVLVLLVVNVLPHDIKSMLVYWRPRGILPGCEAFTKYGPGDNRIDMTALKKNVGALPTDPIEQNAKWYRLYKLVSNEPEVAEAQKLFLMYRDMAVLSLLLILPFPVTLYFVGSSVGAQWLAAAIISVQYLLTAISARWSGIRFVCNVLAVHSAKKVTAPKTGSATSPAAAL